MYLGAQCRLKEWMNEQTVGGGHSPMDLPCLKLHNFPYRFLNWPMWGFQKRSTESPLYLRVPHLWICQLTLNTYMYICTYAYAHIYTHTCICKIIAYVLNTVQTFFLVIIPKQCNTPSIYTVFTLWSGDDLQYMGRCAWVIAFYIRFEHLWI